MLCSVFAGFAGLLLASRLGVGSPTVGQQGGYALLSIAAVVLGGTLLMGGRGSVWGTIGGVAIFAVVDNVMSVMQVNPFLKDVVRGVVIVAAVAVYSRRAVVSRRARFGPGGTRTGGDAAAAASAPAMAAAAHQLAESAETHRRGRCDAMNALTHAREPPRRGLPPAGDPARHHHRS